MRYNQHVYDSLENARKRSQEESPYPINWVMEVIGCETDEYLARVYHGVLAGNQDDLAQLAKWSLYTLQSCHVVMAALGIALNQKYTMEDGMAVVVRD